MKQNREQFEENARVMATYNRLLAMHAGPQTTVHEGKLDGLESVGTLNVCNPYCVARMKEGGVCAHCYVEKHGYKKALMGKLIYNYDLLTAGIVPFEMLPIVSTILARVESFGDVHNETQARNYLHIIRKNSNSRWAIWSKNPAIYRKAFESEGKPENTTFVLSSFLLNTPAKIPENMEKYVDHVFTVYTLAYLKEHPEIEIDCGFSRCLECQKCYHRTTKKYINEILKEDAKAYLAWKNEQK